MPCSRSENPSLEYVPTSGYGPYAYLGLDHFSGFDSYMYISNVAGGGAGKWVTWRVVYGGVSLEGWIETGDIDTYYGQRFCSGW